MTEGSKLIRRLLALALTFPDRIEQEVNVMTRLLVLLSGLVFVFGIVIQPSSHASFQIIMLRKMPGVSGWHIKPKVILLIALSVEMKHNLALVVCTYGDNPLQTLMVVHS